MQRRQRVCGYRDKISQYTASFVGICGNGQFTIYETSEMVDGLGGVVWDGSFLLCNI